MQRSLYRRLALGKTDPFSVKDAAASHPPAGPRPLVLAKPFSARGSPFTLVLARNSERYFRDVSISNETAIRLRKFRRVVGRGKERGAGTGCGGG